MGSLIKFQELGFFSGTYWYFVLIKMQMQQYGIFVHFVVKRKYPVAEGLMEESLWILLVLTSVKPTRVVSHNTLMRKLTGTAANRIKNVWMVLLRTVTNGSSLK